MFILFISEKKKRVRDNYRDLVSYKSVYAVYYYYFHFRVDYKYEIKYK